MVHSYSHHFQQIYMFLLNHEQKIKQIISGSDHSSPKEKFADCVGVCRALSLTTTGQQVILIRQLAHIISMLLAQRLFSPFIHSLCWVFFFCGGVL